MRSWPRVRKFAVAIWVTLTGGYVIWQGIPFDRATQLLIILTASLAFAVGTTTRAVRVFADWVPFFVLLYGYDYSRGAADTFGFKVRVEEIYNIELSWFGWLFDGQIPTVWLQQHCITRTKLRGGNLLLPWFMFPTSSYRGRSLAFYMSKIVRSGQCLPEEC